jgi:hypothetical protein
MYLEFLRNECTDLIDQLPLNVVRNIIFQHDGAPAHFHNQVVNFLNQEFLGNWIGRGRGHLIQWPPRSPDLTPLDFFYGERRYDGTNTTSIRRNPKRDTKKCAEEFLFQN